MIFIIVAQKQTNRRDKKRHNVIYHTPPQTVYRDMFHPKVSSCHRTRPGHIYVQLCRRHRVPQCTGTTRRLSAMIQARDLSPRFLSNIRHHCTWHPPSWNLFWTELIIGEVRVISETDVDFEWVENDPLRAHGMIRSSNWHR